jgi:hypothetical protein
MRTINEYSNSACAYNMYLIGLHRTYEPDTLTMHMADYFCRLDDFMGNDLVNYEGGGYNE